MGEYRWLRRYGQPTRAARRLVCFPHAGGTASAYAGWRPELPADVELYSVRYPAREDRLNDSPVASLTQMADHIAAELVELDSRSRLPITCFGHSMGASIAHEVGLRLEAAGVPVVLLVVSARPPGPSLPRPSAPLSDAELDELLRRMDPRTGEVLDIPELRDLVWPAIRVDYDATHRYAPATLPKLTCPIVALGGRDDERVSYEHLQAWQAFTAAEFRMRIYDGGHFYHRERPTLVLHDLHRDLELAEAESFV